MKKGRSTYTFQLNCNPNIANNLVQSYISANGFKTEQKDNEFYYKAGDSMVGYRYFNYNISGNVLTIYAWLKGTFGDIEIDQNGIASMNMFLMNYRNSLNKLFQEINKLNNGGINMNNNLNQNNVNNNQMNFDPMTGQPLNQNNNQQPILNNTNQFTQTFKEETTKKQEKLCEIGFWVSIFGVLCALGGVSISVLIFIMDFYFASQGLKTRKRGKAIATIVLSILSILITILVVMASV